MCPYGGMLKVMFLTDGGAVVIKLRIVTNKKRNKNHRMDPKRRDQNRVLVTDRSEGSSLPIISNHVYRELKPRRDTLVNYREERNCLCLIKEVHFACSSFSGGSLGPNW